jgi:hypothetical protein
METLYRVVARLLGLLLLLAAVLKLYGLAVGPVAKVGFFSAAWFQALVVSFEIGLGLWLVSGEWAVWSWLVSLLTFTIFAGISFRAAWVGQATCNCFGPVPLSPWYAFGLDVGVLALLGLARPDLRNFQQAPSADLSVGMRAAACSLLGVALVSGVVAGVSYATFGSLSAALAYGRGESLSVQPGVVDVGEGAPGEERSADVRFVNRTARPVRIVGATDDCSCAVIGELPVTIRPGESCSLTVQLKLPPTTGVFTRPAAVVTDDGLKRVRFRVTGRATGMRCGD